MSPLHHHRPYHACLKIVNAVRAQKYSMPIVPLNCQCRVCRKFSMPSVPKRFRCRACLKIFNAERAESFQCQACVNSVSAKHALKFNTTYARVISSQKQRTRACHFIARSMDEKRCFVWAMSVYRHVTAAGSDRIVKLLESSKTIFQNKKSKIYLNFLSTQRIIFSKAPRLDAIKT